MLSTRSSGILLHITSLPGKYGMGDLGPEAYKFADWLKRAGQQYWQVLPLNPPGPASYGSPYSGFSAFAMNTQLISPDILLRDGLIAKRDLRGYPSLSKLKYDIDHVASAKKVLLDAAVKSFLNGPADALFEKFCEQNAYWLDDYTLFAALAAKYPMGQWFDWPDELRYRQSAALKAAATELHEAITREKVLQYIAMRQWFELKSYCNQRGIKIIGDMPIYLIYHSSDVWAHPDMFKLDKEKKPTVVSGVPPDLFSETGQLWGTPVYDWEANRKNGYKWWLSRMSLNLSIFDMVRLDHFRGFAGYWEVPAGDETAINGKWEKGPGEDFFKTLLAHIQDPAVIAEDLGVITADVRELIQQFNLPSMKVLSFAFGGDDGAEPYLPHNHVPNSIVYTGTHDNNTVRGWFEKEAKLAEKRRIGNYLGRMPGVGTVAWEFVRMAMMSTSRLAIFPLQDIMGLGGDARMNHPGKAKGNWSWRVPAAKLTGTLADKLRRTTTTFGRA